MEMMRMVSSGTDVSALRLARGATGRDGILKFQGVITVMPTVFW